MNRVTIMLAEIEAGNQSAAEELLPLVYDELRALARAKLAGERPGQTLQATGLVHEAYLRLVGSAGGQHWDSRGHFFAAAAEAMRRLLIDRARRRKTTKHGGEFQRVTFNSAHIADQTRDDEMLALDEALDRLQHAYPIKADLVKLRFFAGLTTAQAADALGISVSTAERYWAYSRCWPRAEISRSLNP